MELTQLAFQKARPTNVIRRSVCTALQAEPDMTSVAGSVNPIGTTAVSTESGVAQGTLPAVSGITLF